MRLIFSITLLGFACAASISGAQDYPHRQITLVLPYPPGSGLDMLSRDIAEHLAKRYGQPVVVENKSGASGNIGTEHVARSQPDGYTLVLTTNAPLLFNKYTIKSTFDPYKDLAPVVPTSEGRMGLAIAASLPVNTLAEFIKYARDNRGKLSYASSGAGSPHHIAGEYLKDVARIDMTHVPYRGSVPAINDLVAGHIPVGVITYGNILPFALQGKVKILGIIGDTRSELAPDVPVIREMLPEYANAPTVWNGILAPAGTPRAIILKLNKDINEILNDAELRKRQASVHSVVLGGPPEALTSRMKREEEIADRLAAKIGLSKP